MKLLITQSSLVSRHFLSLMSKYRKIRGSFEKLVDWRQCATVMQREAVTLMPSCSGGGNVVVA
jgi:hypothetical protein